LTDQRQKLGIRHKFESDGTKSILCFLLL